jgi:hypothetical protein
MREFCAICANKLQQLGMSFTTYTYLVLVSCDSLSSNRLLSEQSLNEWDRRQDAAHEFLETEICSLI